MGEDISFPFPFSPYDVQEAFMKNMYSVLQNGQIGIFESPTGTGKSLSLICGSLKWLKDFQSKQKGELEKILSEEIDEPEDDWFNSFLDKQKKTHQLQDAKEEHRFLVEYENRMKALKNSQKSKIFKMKSDLPPAKRKKHDADEKDNELSDEEFIVDVDREESETDVKDEKRHVLKIYYASRTHSQLAQFLGEIQRSPFKDEVTVTTLGSRVNFCVNESVSKLKNLSLINERCVDLQRKKGSAKKCPYNKNFSEMEDTVLSAVRDIEEIVRLGKDLHSCPYYATRRIIPDVEIVLLPYNVLLHKSTRDAYGIVLKNNIIIIDEAHNLVEAVNNMYSAEISWITLEQTVAQLDSYLKSYKTRFSQDNLRLIKLLIQISTSFVDYLKSLTDNYLSGKIMSVSDFMNVSRISNVNVFEVVKFAENSLIGQKLHGFTASRVAKGITPADDQNRGSVGSEKSGTASFLLQIKEMNRKGPNEASEVKKEDGIQYRPSAIFSFIEFLKTMTFPSKDGRIVIQKTSAKEKSILKFLHLNPSTHFQDIVQEARSIVLAGGTMQPINEFTEQLFLPCGVPESRISFFSCDHVIPADNLLAIGLATGPCGSTLDFTFKSRQLPDTIKELGSVLLNVTNAIKGGVVCFFPSYEYEEYIYTQLTKSKTLESIGKKYKVFREPKLSSDVDGILSEYAKCITRACAQDGTQGSNSGALLFSIVGGKMSEGINFSDDLGRCVIMVGLPYPNKFSIELQEKMAYLNQKSNSSSVKSAGDIYYNNLCMKAVNQSIGRAIRHKDDYASIILLDYRYNKASVKDLLPGWISKSFSFHQKFGSAYIALRKFFLSKNKP